MAKAHGKATSITFPNMTVGDAAVTLSDGIDTVDVTTFDDGAAGFRKWLAGLRDWEVTIQGKWDDTPNTAEVGDEGALVITWTAGSTSSGNAILIGHPITSDVSDAVTDEYSFKGNGALTAPA